MGDERACCRLAVGSGDDCGGGSFESEALEGACNVGALDAESFRAEHFGIVAATDVSDDVKVRALLVDVGGRITFVEPNLALAESWAHGRIKREVGAGDVVAEVF